jgi:hypothetical protein
MVAKHHPPCIIIDATYGYNRKGKAYLKNEGTGFFGFLDYVSIFSKKGEERARHVEIMLNHHQQNCQSVTSSGGR